MKKSSVDQKFWFIGLNYGKTLEPAVDKSLHWLASLSLHSFILHNTGFSRTIRWLGHFVAIFFIRRHDCAKKVSFYFSVFSSYLPHLVRNLFSLKTWLNGFFQKKSEQFICFCLRLVFTWLNHFDSINIGKQKIVKGFEYFTGTRNLMFYNWWSYWKPS